jgi:hypothetical protein
LVQCLDDLEIVVLLPVEVPNFFPIQNNQNDSGAQAATYSIMGLLPLKKAAAASNFHFPSPDAVLRIGGAVHPLPSRSHVFNIGLQENNQRSYRTIRNEKGTH